MTQLALQPFSSYPLRRGFSLPGGFAYVALLLLGVGIFVVACLYCVLHGFETQPFSFDASLTMQWAIPRWGGWPLLLPLCYFFTRLFYQRSSLIFGLLVAVVLAVLGTTFFAYATAALFGNDQSLFTWAYHHLPIAAATLLFVYAVGYIILSKRGLGTEPQCIFDNDECEKLSVWKGRVQTSIVLDDIEWARAARNYVELSADGALFIRRSSLKDVENLGEPGQLLRVHRSYLIKPGQMAGIEGGRSRPRLIMSSGDVIPVGKSYRDAVFELLRSQSILP